MAVSSTASPVAQAHRHANAAPYVIVVGLRGAVGVQGGIETHARMLYPRLARLGYRIEIIQRSPYYPRRARPKAWHGVTLTYLWSPMRPALETAVHTLLAIAYAAIKRPDLVHVHAIGPGLLVPVARLLGLRVVLTHHASDYAREKWGGLAKLVLRAGERLGVRFANRPIAVSPQIKNDLKRRIGVDTTLIPNGAPRPLRARTFEAGAKLGLTRSRYVLCVARLEPTKRQLDLLDAFEDAWMPGWKLVFVGDVAPGDAYSERVRQRVLRNRGVVLAGYQTGRALHELYSHAGLFVLPSSLEGHPIALLEAASYALPILASEIPAHLATPLAPDSYFPLGDARALAQLLTEVAANPARRDADRCRVCSAVRAEYSWRQVALRTKAVYDEVCDGRQVCG